jgi:hypothetical protein
MLKVELEKAAMPLVSVDLHGREVEEGLVWDLRQSLSHC